MSSELEPETDAWRVTLNHRGGNWVGGDIGPYKVEAKMFEAPSHYGIEADGRISKLWITDDSGELYGWDRGPATDPNLPEMDADEFHKVVAVIGVWFGETDAS